MLDAILNKMHTRPCGVKAFALLWLPDAAVLFLPALRRSKCPTIEQCGCTGRYSNIVDLSFIFRTSYEILKYCSQLLKRFESSVFVNLKCIRKEFYWNKFQRSCSVYQWCLCFVYKPWIYCTLNSRQQYDGSGA